MSSSRDYTAYPSLFILLLLLLPMSQILQATARSNKQQKEKRHADCQPNDGYLVRVAGFAVVVLCQGIKCCGGGGDGHESTGGSHFDCDGKEHT
jgi:hypothetical protein